MIERDKMLAGGLYDASDPELVTDCHCTPGFVQRDNALPPGGTSARTYPLQGVLGHILRSSAPWQTGETNRGHQRAQCGATRTSVRSAMEHALGLEVCPQLRVCVLQNLMSQGDPYQFNMRTNTIFQ